MINQAGATIKLRRDTAEDWTIANPVLSEGEPGLETDTRLIKYGDGTTPWNELEYSAVATALLAAPVSIVAPETTTPGSLWFDTTMDQMKVYVESTGSWVALAPKHIRYSFNESTNWLVQHNRNTTAYTVNLTDTAGNLFYAKISIIDNNSFSVNLLEATSGVVDVTFL